jgi:hypothetical protein
VLTSIAFRSSQAAAPGRHAESHRFDILLSAIRVGLAGLLAAIAFVGCSTAAATPGPTSAASSQPSAQSATATTPGSTVALQPPAAPTGLAEWIVINNSWNSVPAYYKWTAPAGPISGYYLWILGTFVEGTPPAAVCGDPGWLKLPASATTYNMAGVQADAPKTYICAFNDAGMSPVVKFPVVDQANAPTSGPQELPAAPTWLFTQLVPVGASMSEDLTWTPPAASIRGYYLNIVFYEAGDMGTPAPEPCGPTWKKVSASVNTYTIPAVETPPLVYICAFNDAGTSPTVMFPEPERG